ncbi:uncharacterized protein LOC134026615 [Osmerus eperlanus]|uniref:uncharacterized protein LOC134026615 n=1 Tax=Osmerus eperlanus TaxID=29151 RepID=UPI002E159D30
MLWYQHRPVSRDMTLIGYGYATSDPSYEGQFQESFQLTREDILRGALLLPRAAPADSAVYFCAATGEVVTSNMLVTVLGLLLTLIYSCEGSGPTVLQAPRDLVLHAGQSDQVTLQCSVGPGLSMSSYTMLWYRQAGPGAPIEYLTKEYETPEGRLQPSIDTSSNSFTLRISELSPDDSSTYLCAASHSAAKQTGSHANTSSEANDIRMHERLIRDVQEGVVALLVLLVSGLVEVGIRGTEGAGGSVVVEQVGEVAGGLVVKGFVSEKKDFKVNALWHGEPVEVLEDGGDVVTGAGVSEQKCDGLSMLPKCVTLHLPVATLCLRSGSSGGVVGYHHQCLDSTGSQMRMLASSMGKNVSSVEAGPRYAMSRPNLTYSSLEIRQLEGQDSAVYLCASTTGTLTQSSHMARQQPRNHTVDVNYNPAFFGGGTKLTVLDPDISDKAIQPNVTVLPPSIHECKDAKDNKNKKTLVCVATGFYPDHVSVSWKLGDRIVTDGVGTDNSAVWNNKTKYSITSRLRVPAGEWYTDSNKFTCTVLFFDGTEYIPFESSVMGDKAQSTGGMTTENYVKSTQTAKLAYIVFIAKSSLYGFFVVVFVWKLQGKSGKHFT